MRDLTPEERSELERIRDKGYEEIKNGYVYYSTWKPKKHYKRSRVLLQLHLNKKLDAWEIVHHIDENKLNDCINNLKIMKLEDHSNHHHAGKRRKR